MYAADVVGGWYAYNNVCRQTVFYVIFRIAIHVVESCVVCVYELLHVQVCGICSCAQMHDKWSPSNQERCLLGHLTDLLSQGGICTRNACTCISLTQDNVAYIVICASL